RSRPWCSPRLPRGPAPSLDAERLSPKDCPVAPAYDLVVIGGGITGAGIARDAALRGLQVALFEKNDYGSGTSSKSSKLIHGGLRYLEHGEIGLVFESVSERRVQTRVAPHLVRPLPFLIPIYKGVRPGLEIMNVGLWIYDSLALFRAPRLHKTFRGTKGVHIVLPRERLPLARAITLISPVDGRVMFAIPWRERTVLGTTDTDFVGSADDVAADAADVKYLCESGNGYFPGANLTTADVIATWAGLRPLIAAPPDVDESEISREHEVFTRPDGLVIIAGGKLTTYRRMAREAVAKSLELLHELGEQVPA